MFNPKSQVIKLITLICLERRLGKDVPLSVDLIQQTQEILPIEDASVEVEWGKQAYNELKQYTSQLVNLSYDEHPHESELLQQIKIIVRDDTYLYDAIATTLSDVAYDDKETTIKLIESIRRGLSQSYREKKIEDITKRYLHQLQYKRDEIPDVNQFLLQMGEECQPYVQSSLNEDPAFMGGVDFNDAEGLEDAFRKAQKALSTEGALKPGWQAMRRFLGPCEGFKRGEFVLMGALKHNFKSGMMMCLFIQLMWLNKPQLRDPSKKPMMLFISYENELAGNIKFIFEYIYSNKTGQAPDFENITPAEMAKYVSEFFESTGYHVKMVRIDPSDFTYSRLIAYLESIQHQGYEIIALFIDYFNMMSKRGLETSATGDDIRLLARRIRNYTSPRDITCFTPHQLSSAAQQLSREGAEGFAKTVANQAYWDGCVRLGHEPDLEFAMHIVKRFKKSFLDVYRGKHRYTVTPEEHQGFTLPFDPITTLAMDIGKEDISVSLDDNEFDSGGEDGLLGMI